MTQLRFQDICFTSFKTDLDWFKDWTQVPKSIVSYIILQGELTKDGKEHIQGYCQFTGQKRMEQIKKFFNDPALHIEKTLGKPEQASNYCKQIKNGIFKAYEEYGEMKIKAQGKRNDLIELREEIKAGKSLKQIQLETDDNNKLHLTLHYNRTLKELEYNVKQERFRESIKSEFENITWRPFQLLILKELENIADKRKIKWVFDEEGNSGKSFLARYLMLKEDVYYITGGKQQDILYGYENQSVIIYDLARTYADNLEHIYTTIENFKNGMYLSTKYESKQRYFKVPHIIVMANFKPDLSKLSNDRWDILELEKDNKNIVNNDTSKIIDNMAVNNKEEKQEDEKDYEGDNEEPQLDEDAINNIAIVEPVKRISVFDTEEYKQALQRYRHNKKLGLIKD